MINGIELNPEGDGSEFSGRLLDMWAYHYKVQIDQSVRRMDAVGEMRGAGMPCIQTHTPLRTYLEL